MPPQVGDHYVGQAVVPRKLGTPSYHGARWPDGIYERLNAPWPRVLAAGCGNSDDARRVVAQIDQRVGARDHERARVKIVKQNLSEQPTAVRGKALPHAASLQRPLETPAPT